MADLGNGIRGKFPKPGSWIYIKSCLRICNFGNTLPTCGLPVFSELNYAGKIVKSFRFLNVIRWEFLSLLAAAK